MVTFLAVVVILTSLNSADQKTKSKNNEVGEESDFGLFIRREVTALNSAVKLSNLVKCL